jgi:NitT/TauT family transport system substrate-binding protein
MRRSALLRTAAAAAMASIGAAPRRSSAQTLTTVSIGAVLSITDAPLLIANDKGFFRDAGIAADLHDFSSAADMISSLGSGQLDLGGGSDSAGLYNAVARGIQIRIIADRQSARPGYGFIQLVVRKDLVSGGKFKSVADLKGMKIAEPAKGTAILCDIVKVLDTAKLSYGDVQHAYIGFPLQVTALQNASIDATIMPEPYVTLLKQSGVALSFARNDQFYPDQEASMMFCSEQFATQKAAVAKRFMYAYLRGQRYFLDSLKGAQLGPNAGDVVDILNKRLKIPPEVLREMTVGYPHPDGKVNVKSLEDDLSIYKKQGLIVGNATVGQIVDMSFADDAVKQLGPYKPKR